MIDPVSAFLKRANINLPGPISSSLVISTPSSPAGSADATTAKVLQYHNIPDPVAAASKVLSTLNCCSDLLTSIDYADSNIKLLRIQSETSHSLIITGMICLIMVIKKIYLFPCFLNYINLRLLLLDSQFVLFVTLNKEGPTENQHTSA